MDDDKTTPVKVGRPISHNGTLYGVGTYSLDATTARGLRAKRAHLSSDAYIRGERQKIREQQEREDNLLSSPATPDAGTSESSTSRLNALESGASLQPGDGEPLFDNSGDETDDGDQGRTFGGSVESEGGGVDQKIMSLTGPLPDDFPARELLIGGGVNTLEKLVAMKEGGIKGIPGIGQARIDAIGQRLYVLAQGTPAK